MRNNKCIPFLLVLFFFSAILLVASRPANAGIKYLFLTGGYDYTFYCQTHAYGDNCKLKNDSTGVTVGDCNTYQFIGWYHGVPHYQCADDIGDDNAGWHYCIANYLSGCACL